MNGTYIDGFAGPQDPERPETWAAKLVLEMEPKWFRDFWLCELTQAGVDALKAGFGTGASWGFGLPRSRH